MRLDNLIKFLKAVEQKTASEDIDSTLSFDGITIAIVLIGRYEKIKRVKEKWNPYVSYIKNEASKRIMTFYVLARGGLNCCVADATVAEVTKSKVIVKTNEYRDEAEHQRRRIPVLCIRLENRILLEDPVTVYQKSNQ
jgi:hypothetical protein